ncbi:MAG: hypothetical protein SPL47_07715 [Bacteroidales bacterium]|nr:hypothetical protein [Bacteroidales bacterium]
MNPDILGIIMIIIIVIGCCVVLPLMIVWLVNKRKNHEIDKKTEVLMLLLEKKPDIDPAEVLNKLNMSQNSDNKSLKQKLLGHLLAGCIYLLVGLVIFFTHLFNMIFFGSKTMGVVGGGVLAAIGIAFIIYYFVSRKMLQGEIEAEERRLTEQQISE